MSDKDTTEDDDLLGKDKNIDGEDTDDLEEEDDSDGSDDGDDEGDKPITMTKKELDAYLAKKLDSRFANNRRGNKNLNRPYKPNPSKAGKGDEDPNASRIERLEVSDAKRNFGYEHQLSPREVDLVFKYAGGKPTAKTLQDPFIQGGLEKLRAQSNLRDNTPSGSGSSSFEVDGKKFEELDAAGKQANFAAKQRAILAKKR